MVLDSDPIVGMVHLPPLPGAPGFDGDREAICERAVADARALEDGGIDALLVENFGDAPFYPDDVPAHVVTHLTAIAGAVADAVSLPIGINVLRNDARTALSIADAVGASFVRVNVHVGARVTDQGVIEGRAHETLRLRDRLGSDVAILADHRVKHSAALAPEAVSLPDLVERGRADGVVISGSGTGSETPIDALQEAVAERDAHELDVPVFAGSGVDRESVQEVLTVADGAIVGTALKVGGETTVPVDSDAVERLVERARR